MKPRNDYSLDPDLAKKDLLLFSPVEPVRGGAVSVASRWPAAIVTTNSPPCACFAHGVPAYFPSTDAQPARVGGGES